MFKFLSMFKRNNAQQLADNKYDFLVIPALERDIDEERDRHIAQLLYQHLNENEPSSKPRKGVIVYGADHLNSLDPVIQQMFGNRPGEYTQLVKQDNQSIQTEQ